MVILIALKNLLSLKYNLCMSLIHCLVNNLLPLSNFISLLSFITPYMSMISTMHFIDNENHFEISLFHL